MEDRWWERPACFICDYGWVILLALVLVSSAILTRQAWLPWLGLQPAATAVPPVSEAPPDPAPTRALGSGDIQATLWWASTNDLDLWVIDPDGNAIYYQQPGSPSGGVLDVDANADCLELRADPVENIFWPAGQAPTGSYRVEVHYYRQCTQPARTQYTVRLLVDGQVTEYQGVLETQDQFNLVTAFDR